MARVLVADDDLFYRNLVSTWIKAMGHDVENAADGAKALDLCVNGDFDLLVLDVFMEKMTGIEILKRLTKNADVKAKTRVPVVIITSDDSEGTEMEARLERASFYLLKPFSKELLASIVDESVRTAAMRR